MNNKFEKPSKKSSTKESLPEDYWFQIIQRLCEERGRIPDPLEVRSTILLDAFGIPYGPYSAIEVDKEGKRINPEKDRIIAEYLTNHPGVLIEKGIVSLDFRDIYPDGLPQELKEVLDPDTRAIMEIEYEHAEDVQKKFGETQNIYEADVPIHYFRLPGGIDLFLRGYIHDRNWQKNHGEYFKKANQYAEVIAIEGFAYVPFGNSLELRWFSTEFQEEHYDALMKDAVKSGFNGLFTEVDARDASRIKMDNTIDNVFYILFLFPDLPDDFFKNYFEFLKREHPSLASKIGSPKNLKKVLKIQSTTHDGTIRRRKGVFKYGKQYFGYPYLSKRGGISFEPTFLELGQHLFSDALAAIKLHLIAKLMADGHIEKGPIIDYEGTGHLSSKSFFLKYPQYAMEVVLRTINELMAGKVEKLPEIYEVFRNPNWPEIIKEIARLVFRKPEPDASKPVEIGPNQRRLLDIPIDFLKIYNINSERVMPSDDEIRSTIAKIAGQRRKLGLRNIIKFFK
jgi:hypothetical protein